MDPGRLRRALQAAAVAAALAPLALLAARAAGVAGDLGANPVEALSHATGDWALRCLLACLAVTPLRFALRLAALAPLRRTLGLAAFGWACLHVLVWAVLDLGLDVRAMLEDVRERRYVLAGMTAFLCLAPLAATSTRAAQRRLGSRWKTLHRLVYVGAAAAVTHYLWLVKADLLAPASCAALLALLLGARLRRRRAAAQQRPGTFGACTSATSPKLP